MENRRRLCPRESNHNREVGFDVSLLIQREFDLDRSPNERLEEDHMHSRKPGPIGQMANILVPSSSGHFFNLINGAKQESNSNG